MLESPDYFFRVREIGRLRQTTSRSIPHVGFVRMRGVASVIRESFVREVLYFIQFAKVFIRESFRL